MPRLTPRSRRANARRQWTLAALLDELRYLHRRGVRITTADLLAARETAVLGAIQRLVGSIVRARELAQLPDLVTRAPTSRQRWSTARVLRAIRDRQAAGASLATSRIPSTLRDAAIAWCGSWQAALTQAGIDPRSTRMQPLARSRAEALSALRDLARAQPTMSRAELRGHAVGGLVLRRFASLDEALREAGIAGWPFRRQRVPAAPRVVRRRPAEERRQLSAAEVTAVVRRRHAAGEPLTMAAIRRADPDAANAIGRHYQTLIRMLQRLGLPVRGQRWTRTRVTTELRRRASERRSLRSEAVRREEPALHRATQRVFGSYRAALARAVPTAVPPSLTSVVEVTEALRARHRGGLSLRAADVPARLRAAVRRLLGTWQAGLEQAGLPVGEILRQRRWTDAQLIAALRACAARKRDMTVTELQRTPLGTAAATRFGSLREAVRRAQLIGWPRRLRRPLPAAVAVLNQLRKRARQGEPLRLAAVTRAVPRLAKAALKHFGTWRAAMIAAGLGDQVYERRWPVAKVIDALRARAARGLGVSEPELIAHDHRLYLAACGRFGSVEDAVRAAGLGGEPGEAT